MSEEQPEALYVAERTRPYVSDEVLAKACNRALNTEECEPLRLFCNLFATVDGKLHGGH